MVRFWCQCGRQLKANERAAGEVVQCSLCRRLIIVPEQDVPRTADFPPVPPRGSINTCGEITRGHVGPVAVPEVEADEPARGWAWVAWLFAILLLFGSLVVLSFAWPIHRASWLLVALALLGGFLAIALGLIVSSLRPNGKDGPSP